MLIIVNLCLKSITSFKLKSELNQKYIYIFAKNILSFNKGNIRR